MKRWDGDAPLATGVVLTRNALWRAGYQELWEFYRVSHTTAKGTVMVHPLGRRKTKGGWDGQQNSVGTVRPENVAEPEGGCRERAKRLAPGKLYYLLTDAEVRDGIPEEGCCR